MEESVLAFWNERGIFQKSVDARSGQAEYVFYDGPPFATGLPHFGHFVPGTIKDVIPRYQTMKGRRVERRFGWDCHGLPVEYEIEKELGISGRAEIEAYGVGAFNDKCRSIVLRYTGEWERIVSRMGRWVDFRNDYKTMDPDYMESIWWVFRQLWDQGLVYEGYYILPYSWKLATPLSNFEVNLGGYREVDDPAVTVRFQLKDPTTLGASSTDKVSFLAWTTTPWTLPSNLGLALGPEVSYVRIADGEEQFILARERLGHYYKDPADCTVLAEYSGRDLAGVRYVPVFPYFAEIEAQDAFQTWTADYVTTEDGTGIVHIAPGFGEDDYQILKDSDVPILVPIDDDCRFTAEVPDFQGQFVKDADKPIIAWLREQGLLVRRENYRHPYPFDYRTNTPLIYRAVSSWFVDVDKIKDRMLAHNSTINWIPDHLRDGRFGKWLEGARAWAISRNRYWGNPLPIWRNESGYTEVISSREELEAKVGHPVPDLHKQYVDELTWEASDGSGTMRRVPQVLDCWFESGAMPFAQAHYPFANRERFDANFPADFIAEGLDQTRGWFYTLTIIASALRDCPAFRNVIVNGLVLAEDGRKMSKSLRNYTDPVEIINTYGADALRLFLMNSSVVKAEDLKYSDDGVRDVLKQVIIPLWNAYSFYVTYANIDGIQPDDPPAQLMNPLDRWILSAAQTLVAEVEAQLDAYEMQKAIGAIVRFIEQLNNWYIRRSRRRFWKSESDSDKREAYATLRSVLMTLVTVAAPFMPFTTEAIYRNLRREDQPESVHLVDWPEVQQSRRVPDLEARMDHAQTAVSLGRALRSTQNLKVRQPLRAVHLVTRDADQRRSLREMEDLIRDELNVKDVIFRGNEEELVEYRAKANYRVLGRKLGKAMPEAAARISEFSPAEIQTLLDGNTLSLEIGGENLELTSDEVLVERDEKDGLKVLNEGALTVALDPEIGEELRDEGLVRDLIRAIQQLRKDTGLEVTDRVVIGIQGPQRIIHAVESHREFLMDETLCVRLDYSAEGGGEVMVDGEPVQISVSRK